MTDARRTSDRWYRTHWKDAAFVWVCFGLLLMVGFAVLIRARSSTRSPRRSALIAVQPSADYPLAECAVCGEPLPPVGDRIAVTYDGIEVQVRCDVCVDTLGADPETYVARVRAARK